MTGARVAIVTGASSGIGEACAARFAERGLRVYGASRNPNFRPERFRPLLMDVTSTDSVARAVEEVARRENRIDVVVNGAGFGLAGSIEDTSLDEAVKQFETNFFGVFRVCRAVLPRMRQQRDGLIINIGSLGGLFSLPFQGFYSASKFALEGLSESLRQEVYAFGIRVVLLEPGDVLSRFTENRVLAAGASAQSAYEPVFRKALEIIESDERHGSSPESVAAVASKLIGLRRPRVRYALGRIDQRMALALKKLIPSKYFSRVVMSHYGLLSPHDRASAASSNEPPRAA